MTYMHRYAHTHIKASIFLLDVLLLGHLFRVLYNYWPILEGMGKLAVFVLLSLPHARLIHSFLGPSLCVLGAVCGTTEGQTAADPDMALVEVQPSVKLSSSRAGTGRVPVLQTHTDQCVGARGTLRDHFLSSVETMKQA